MIRILTSDLMLRFFSGFGIGCLVVMTGAYGLFSGAA
jgi:hypothetical protein